MAGGRGRGLQIVAISLASAPAVGLAVAALRDDLGANPIETVTHVTGEWTLRLLLLTLAVTPLRRLLGLRIVAPLRRTFGLLTFGYACLHFLTWLALDLFFDWEAIAEDVLERRYIAVGFASFLMLAPLAVTSTRAAMKRLGSRWNTLHRLVYVAAAGGVLHFWWLVKADQREPLVYAGALAVLLGYRWLRRTRLTAAAAA